jgi:PAS domain S-box-containing protein
MRLETSPTWFSYALAVVATVSAVAFRWLIDPWLGDQLPVVTLFAAVAVSVWLGGYRPAVLAAGLGYSFCHYLFVEPRGSWTFGSAVNVVGLLAYIVSCTVIIGFGQAFRIAQMQANARRDVLRTTLANIADAVITTDTQGRIVYMNSVAETLTGWPQKEAIERPLDSVFHILDERTRERLESPITRALREETIVGPPNHTILVTRDGTERPIDGTASPIRDERDELAGWVLVFRDITNRRRDEQALKFSEQRLRNIFETAGVSLWEKDFTTLISALASLKAQGITDFAGYLKEHPAFVQQVLESIRVLEVNQTTVKMFEAKDEAELVGSVARIFGPDFMPVFSAALVAIAEGRTYFEAEALLSTVRGNPLYVFFTIVLSGPNGLKTRALLSVFDITARKRAEEELEKADRRKDEFLAILAHELRNPLTAVRTSIEMIRRADAYPGLADEAFEIIGRQVNQMQRLIDDLLDISRITRNQLELRKESVELAPVLRQALEACRSSADISQHEVTVSWPDEPIYVSGDPARLAQVFGNLLNNAYKYTPRGGHIALTAQRQGKEVLISVKDTGRGISQEILPRIFDGFMQFQDLSGHPQGGLRIGLKLVKQLVEMHGGIVEVKSEGADRGSEFLVRLPTT